MAQILAPFTDEQVNKLQQWQNGLTPLWQGDIITDIIPFHPFTCCSYNGCKRDEQPNEGALIPTNDGWICPCGAYKQNWCHDFMANPPVVFPEPDGKSLFKRVVDLLKLAREKGYPKYNDLRPLIHMPFLRNDNLTFSAIITATIQQWLRLEKNVIVWIEPTGSLEGRELFVWFVKYYGTYNSHPSKRSSHLYELELIEGIEFALNTLPPTNG